MYHTSYFTLDIDIHEAPSICSKTRCLAKNGMSIYNRVSMFGRGSATYISRA